MKKLIKSQATIKVQVLLTGNELMSGVTTDSNSAMIADKLATIGMALSRKVTIGDDMDVLVEEMEALSLNSDVLVVNGGLGPTIDDLTSEAVSKLIGKPLVENTQAIAHLEGWCRARSYPLNQANRKQAFLPEGAEVVANAVGSAVGFTVKWNNCVIICTPGVPSELRVMLDKEILKLLIEDFPNAVAPSITRLQLFGLGESGLQQSISDDFPDWPANVEVSFRAGVPTLELKLTTFTEEDEPEKELWKTKLLLNIGDYVVGEGSTDLQTEVVALLADQNKTLTTVESCTGGLIASKITEVPGASAVFQAGFVTYSDDMKKQLVGVPDSAFNANGAVSEAVVKEMVKGGLKISGADLGVAVSGIAGPDGGTDSKPVGTVWIAWGSDDTIYTQRLVIGRNRKLFQLMVSAIALDLIRRLLLNIQEPPVYFSTYQ